MTKQFRVKRYYSKNGGGHRKKTGFVGIIIFVLFLAGLAYVGTIIYRPVYDFVMNIGKQEEIIYTEPETPEPEQSQPDEPEPVVKPEPEKLRAVYVPFDTAADNARFEEFLRGLDGTEINAVMLDIKDADGNVLFKSENEMAVKWGVIAPNAVDLKAVSARLERDGMSLIVKMSAFRDPKAASAGRLDYAINYRDSDFLWLDNSPEAGGKPWLNPYSRQTLDYLNSLALEAVDAGAKLLVLENVQFPDNSAVYAEFGPDAAEMDRAEALRSFVKKITELAEEKDARVSVYYPAIAAAQEWEQLNRYGGSPLKIPYQYMLLGAQPSQFETGFSESGLEIKAPLKDPAGAVKASINYVKQGVSSDTKIIPMLQGGNDLPFNDAEAYSAPRIKEQIAAVGELQLQEYILYNAEGKYLLK